MKGKDIFSALAKYNSATDENYLTEAFVFVINLLLQRERPVGLEILTKLCLDGDEHSFDRDEKITVKTQVSIEQDRPDITISSLGKKLIYVEVKHDSDLGDNQLERYRNDLESSDAPCKRLILLSRFSINISEKQAQLCDKHVFWSNIYDWLTNARAKTQDFVCRYLMESFKSFLEVKQMAMQKVSWEYIKGVPAFNNLIDMLGVAIKGASLRVHQRSAGWGRKGFYVEGTEFLCSVSYNNPLVIAFQMVDKTKFNKELVKSPTYEVREGKQHVWFRLPLEKVHFFSLDKDKQLEEITKFVRMAYAEAQQMRIE